MNCLRFPLIKGSDIGTSDLDSTTLPSNPTHNPTSLVSLYLATIFRCVQVPVVEDVSLSFLCVILWIRQHPDSLCALECHIIYDMERTCICVVFYSNSVHLYWSHWNTHSPPGFHMPDCDWLSLSAKAVGRIFREEPEELRVSWGHMFPCQNCQNNRKFWSDQGVLLLYLTKSFKNQGVEVLIALKQYLFNY